MRRGSIASLPNTEAEAANDPALIDSRTPFSAFEEDEAEEVEEGGEEDDETSAASVCFFRDLVDIVRACWR